MNLRNNMMMKTTELLLIMSVGAWTTRLWVELVKCQTSTSCPAVTRKKHLLIKMSGLLEWGWNSVNIVWNMYIGYRVIIWYMFSDCDNHYTLTHWGGNKMADFSQTTFSNSFSSMKMLANWFKFNWDLFLCVHLTISQHWSRKWLGAN